jgi:hypothetical protein
MDLKKWIVAGEVVSFLFEKFACSCVQRSGPAIHITPLFFSVSDACEVQSSCPHLRGSNRPYGPSRGRRAQVPFPLDSPADISRCLVGSPGQATPNVVVCRHVPLAGVAGSQRREELVTTKAGVVCSPAAASAQGLEMLPFKPDGYNFCARSVTVAGTISPRLFGWSQKELVVVGKEPSSPTSSGTSSRSQPSL